jgi:SAM-dependent methyltransferase
MENLVCPRCHGPLAAAPDAYSCDPCARRYPILCGIPDFRLLPDRYISIEDDRLKGQRLFDASPGRTFADMLDLYWSMTPEVPSPQAAKFKAHQLAEAAIGRVALYEVPHAGDSLVDVGCSTGGFLIAAANRFPHLVGVDVAFRWLVVGLVRLREAGVTAQLICANAEHLPFPSASFAVLTANDLLEHVLDPAPVFAESRRVLQPSGFAYFSTNNRYSLLPEPHVGVWGVGLLPRSLQPRYVQLMTGRPYQNLCLRSGPELRASALRAGFAGAKLCPAPPAAAPDRVPRAQAWYNAVRKTGLGAALLKLVGPRIQLLCRK